MNPYKKLGTPGTPGCLGWDDTPKAGQVETEETSLLDEIRMLRLELQELRQVTFINAEVNRKLYAALLMNSQS